MHLLDTKSGPHWQRVGVRNHHGINVPVFSLRTEDSCGIGEYLDLIPLINWCAELGFDVMQLLPINDSGNDSSPYSILSACALNPLYLSLWRLPLVEEYGLNDLLRPLQKLNEEKFVHYEQVREGKYQFLKTYYETVGNRVKDSLDYLNFLSQNEEWLYQYALFKAVKWQKNWQSWKEWDPIEIDQYTEEVDFHIFLQYLSFSQMSQVKSTAEEKGIFLKGDLPILINFESADAYFNQELFNLNLSAGAPPDMYAETGQNWGFPLYNWQKIAEQQYSWWKRRVQVAEKFYHIYRLDHIVGFYRIWGIPFGKKAIEGHFVPSDERVWVEHGSNIMRMLLDSTSMLPIGEDLGTIPPEVRENMKMLGISGTKVMRWERFWNEDKRFVPFNEYPIASMTCVSTHDTETLKEWWQEKKEDAKTFAKFMGISYQKDLPFEDQLKIIKASHHTKSLFHVNLLQEYLALVPGLTYEDVKEERINTPSVVSEKNWSYRYKPYLSEIIANNELRKIMQYVRSS
jgi:4-alpha-glucanotransferase